MMRFWYFRTKGGWNNFIKPARTISSAVCCSIIFEISASKSTRFSKSWILTTCMGIPARAARVSAYAFRLSLITTAMSIPLVLSWCSCSIRVWRFVPLPETRTAIFNAYPLPIQIICCMSFWDRHPYAASFVCYLLLKIVVSANNTDKDTFLL